MAKVITYECRECGCEIIVSGSHESHLRPIYCCGSEVTKVSSSSKRPEAKKAKKRVSTKALDKVAKKAKGQTAKKISVPRKSSGR